MKSESFTLGEERDPVLNPVERISEMLFGLFMALTFVGAMSAATGDREGVRTMFFAAFGCNLAWGFVDAIMYLVRTATDRGRSLAFVQAVRSAPDASTAKALVKQRLSERSTLQSDLYAPEALEAIRSRVAALPAAGPHGLLSGKDYLASLAIFLIVVAATFPVVLPFIFFTDVDVAKNVSRGIALAMLFIGGYALGRYAGFGSLKAGFTMVGIGTSLVLAIKALGG